MVHKVEKEHPNRNTRRELLRRFGERGKAKGLREEQIPSLTTPQLWERKTGGAVASSSTSTAISAAVPATQKRTTQPTSLQQKSLTSMFAKASKPLAQTPGPAIDDKGDVEEASASSPKRLKLVMHGSEESATTFRVCAGGGPSPFLLLTPAPFLVCQSPHPPGSRHRQGRMRLPGSESTGPFARLGGGTQSPSRKSNISRSRRRGCSRSSRRLGGRRGWRRTRSAVEVGRIRTKAQGGWEGARSHWSRCEGRLNPSGVDGEDEASFTQKVPGTVKRRKGQCSVVLKEDDGSSNRTPALTIAPPAL